MPHNNIVRLSSQSKSFLLQHEYCDNPACPCNAAFLRFTEVGDADERVVKPISFEIRIDLDTWKETDPPSRSARINDWVLEFLAEVSDQRKSELRAAREEARKVRTRVAQYRADPRDVIEGVLISYSGIVHGTKANSNGRRYVSYDFAHQGREFAIDDCYCPNPDCDCETVHLNFYEVRANEYARDDVEHFVVTQSFLGKVTFDGHLAIDDPRDWRSDEALDVLSAWWEQHYDELAVLQRRYAHVKEIGERSLDRDTSQAPRVVKSLRGPNTLHGFELPLEPKLFGDPLGHDENSDEPPGRFKAGRNDPCPCGSGKKFKKCCWRNTKIGL